MRKKWKANLKYALEWLFGICCIFITIVYATCGSQEILDGWRHFLSNVTWLEKACVHMQNIFDTPLGSLTLSSISELALFSYVGSTVLFTVCPAIWTYLCDDNDEGNEDSDYV